MARRLAGRTATDRLTFWAGWALAALAGLLAVAGTSALPAVVDLRGLQLATSIAAAMLLAWRAWRASSARAHVTRAITPIAAVVMMILAGWTARDLFWAYRVEEVAFRSGQISLRGSLYLPWSAGPHAAVVLLHGSGYEPRDGYRYYARRYATRGIAALAYDKRGTGESDGDFRSATYADLAADAANAVGMLRERPDVRADRIGLWGLSEGEWVAPLAARLTEAAFLVLVSPSATTPAAQVQYETGANVRRAGFSAEQANEAEELYALLSEFQRTGRRRDELNRRLAAAAGERWFDAAGYLEPSVPEYERVLALSWFPAWRARMDFDALPVMSDLRCPVLAQAGGRDPKNDGSGALDRIRMALRRGGNDAFTGLLYPEAGHAMLEWRLPFGLPPPWFASGYLSEQLDWVAAQTGSR